MVEYLKDEFIPEKKEIPKRIKKEVLLLLEEEVCLLCGANLTPFFTSKPRKVVTLSFDLHLKVKHMRCSNSECFACINKVSFHNPELERIVLSKHHFAFDVTLLIGHLAYQEHKTEHAIVEYLLVEHGINISQPDVNHYKKIALAITEATMISNSKQIKAQLAKLPARVYVMDGTSSNRSNSLFIVRDLLTGTTLGTVILTEHDGDTIYHFLDEIFSRFGHPDFMVGDGERGLMAAVRLHYKDIPYHYCHTHFFKNMGKALMEELNNHLNKSLKKTIAV